MVAEQKHAQRQAKGSTKRFPFHEQISDIWLNEIASDRQTQSKMILYDVNNDDQIELED